MITFPFPTGYHTGNYLQTSQQRRLTIKSDVWHAFYELEHMHCLDAPEAMPAGSVVNVFNVPVQALFIRGF